MFTMIIFVIILLHFFISIPIIKSYISFNTCLHLKRMYHTALMQVFGPYDLLAVFRLGRLGGKHFLLSKGGQGRWHCFPLIAVTVGEQVPPRRLALVQLSSKNCSLF